MLKKVGRLLSRKSGQRYCNITGEGKPHYIGGIHTTEEEALALYNAIVEEVRLSNLDPTQRHKTTSLSYLFSRYLEEATLPGTEEKQKARKKLCNDFIAEFGSMTMATLTPGRVEKWVKGHKTWNDTTQHHVYKSLNVVFRWLMTEKLSTENPIVCIKKPKAHVRGEEVVISEEEYKLFQPLFREPYQSIITVLWESGCRTSLIVGACGSDYNEAKHSLMFPASRTGAKGKDYQVVLSDVAEKIVQDAIARHGPGLLFPTRTGRQMKLAMLRETWDKVMAKVGIDRPITPYSFRHSFGFRLAQQGVTPHVVARLMNDTLAVYEKHYCHANKDKEVHRGVLQSVQVRP